MDCNGNIYNIGMGCCEPVLGPIENYYTKPTIDRKLEEITSAITSGCCITPEEVDEKIEQAISGITVSGVTEEQMNEAIASAKTQIEAEIPIVPTKVSAFENDVPYLTEHQSLSGYATEQWVEDKHYITGVDLSDYATLDNLTAATDDMATQTWVNNQGYLTEHQSLSAYSTTEQMNAAISAATDGLATEDYVNAQISSQTSDFVTGEQLSSYTYDKGTIDEKIAQGGTFDPTQYYNTGQTDALLAEKLDVTAYTPTDLSNYYTTAETVNLVESAVTRVEGEIPTIPTNISAFNNDVGYITGVDLSNYATKDNLTAATDDMATQTWVNNQGYLTEHQSLSAYSTTDEVNSAITQAVSGKQDTLSAGTNITIVDNVISAQGGGATYTAGTGIDISGDIISTTLPITTGSGQYSVVITTSDNQYKPTASGSYSYAEGVSTSAKGTYSHAEGDFTTATGSSAHAEGHNTKAYGTYSHAEGYNTIASGTKSHTEGDQNRAVGESSHAEGANVTASGDCSHAEGSYTKANASYSHAEGAGSQANGLYSHAEGYFTKTENAAEHASGQYNMSNKASATFGDSGNTLFSVGNGTGINARNNAFEVRQNGDIYITSGNTDILLQDHLGGGSVTIDPSLDSGSTNPVANSAITEAVLVPSYRGLIEVQYDIAFPNATALYVENVTSGGYQDMTMIQFYLSGVSEVSENIMVTSFSGHTFNTEPSYMDYEWTEDNSIIFTPKTSGNYFYKIHNGWDTGFGVYIIDDYSSGSSSSVIQNEIYPRLNNLTEKVDSFDDIKVTGVAYSNLYNDYGGYWYHEINIYDNHDGRFATQDKLRYNDFGYDNNEGIIFVKKTSGVTSGSTECLTSGGAYQALNAKPNVWCGSEADWAQISGGTLDNNCIYLVY